MADKKQKTIVPRRADAGTSRFQLPEREPRERDASFVGELINAAHQQEVETAPISPRPSTPSRGSTPSRDSTQQTSVSPMRDFAKVANSIVRDVVPTGQFTGKSKQLYDYLYSLTRGAIQPSRFVSLTKVRLMVGAGIGSEVTLRANLVKLKSLGLVEEEIIPGTHGGNQYTVYLPEEIEGRPSTPSRASSTPQNLEPLPPLETTPSRASLISDVSIVSGDSKTLIKTKEERFDDDAARAMVEALLQAERELTGKTSSTSAQWRELAEVIIAELKIAAGRTTISSVPAFLAEHLRRRLWKLDKKQAAQEGKELPDQATVKSSIPEGQTCPDCSNTGWWYPNGIDKGVSRCKHERLTTKPSSV
jgi:hypothetical protein